MLRLLQKKARRTNKELANAVGVAESTCLVRIRRLEELGVIRGYHAEVDPHAVGIGMQALWRWKQTSTVASGTAAELEVVVPITSLRDWVDVRRQLEDMVVVRDLEVVMMASDFVRARLRYVGDTGQLAAALADAGLSLEERGADWLLHPAPRQGAGR